MESMKDLMVFVFADFMALITYTYIFSIFLNLKENGKKYLMLLISSNSALLIVYCLVYGRSTSFISFIAVILIVSFAYKDRIYLKVLVTFGTLIIQFLIEILTLVVISVFNTSAYVAFSNNHKGVFATYTAVIFLSSIAIIQYIRKKMNKSLTIDLTQLSRFHIISLSLLLFVVNAYCIFIDQLLSSKAYVNFDIPTAFLLSTLLMAIILIIGVGIYLHRLFINSQLETTNILISKQLSHQLTHYQQLEKNIQETRKLKHDMNNHFLCLSHLISSNDHKAAQTYLQDIKSAIDKIEYNIETGNSIVDAIINDKLKQHQDCGIKFNLEGRFPKGDFIDLIDLCAIVGNSFDNAIEACLSEPSNLRYIDIETYIKQGFWIYKIKNVCNNVPISEKGLLRTTKQNREYHGFGLMNIRNAVEKHHGELKYDHTHNEFVLSIAIPIA